MRGEVGGDDSLLDSEVPSRPNALIILDGEARYSKPCSLEPRYERGICAGGGDVRNYWPEGSFPGVKNASK